MKFNKMISVLVLGVMFSVNSISPAFAVEMTKLAAPNADFTSIWNQVQGMIGDISAKANTTAAPAPEVKPAPAPAPAPEVKPAPAPAPAPEVKPAPAPAPAPEVKPAPAPAPAPEVKPAPAPASGFTPSQFEQEVVRLVNIERQKEGLKPLVLDNLLCKGARAKSQDFIDNAYFGHTSPKYGSPFEMMRTFGVKYSAAGENIASGQRTPASVVQAWMNSPGHRANIMSPKFGKIGVGYAYTTGGNYHHFWTQWFTN